MIERCEARPRLTVENGIESRATHSTQISSSFIRGRNFYLMHRQALMEQALLLPQYLTHGQAALLRCLALKSSTLKGLISLVDFSLFCRWGWLGQGHISFMSKRHELFSVEAILYELATSLSSIISKSTSAPRAFSPKNMNGPLDS